MLGSRPSSLREGVVSSAAECRWRTSHPESPRSHGLAQRGRCRLAVARSRVRALTSDRSSDGDCDAEETSQAATTSRMRGKPNLAGLNRSARSSCHESTRSRDGAGFLIVGVAGPSWINRRAGVSRRGIAQQSDNFRVSSDSLVNHTEDRSCACFLESASLIKAISLVWLLFRYCC